MVHVWTELGQVEWPWRVFLLVLVWRSDRDVQVLQEEVIWKLQVVVVPDLPAPSPAVWICLPHSFLHKYPHHYCLPSSQVVVEVGGTYAVLAWCVVGVGVGDPSAGLEWGCLFGHRCTLWILHRSASGAVHGNSHEGLA